MSTLHLTAKREGIKGNRSHYIALYFRTAEQEFIAIGQKRRLDVVGFLIGKPIITKVRRHYLINPSVRIS